MPPVRPIAISATGLMLSFCEVEPANDPCAATSVAVQLPEVGVPLELSVFACIEGDRYASLGLRLSDVYEYEYDYGEPPGFTLEVVGDDISSYEGSLYANANPSPALCDEGLAVTITRIQADASPNAVLHLRVSAGDDPNRCDLRVEPKP